jgi:predicted Rossmann-fold nucleotide-binding protein
MSLHESRDVTIIKVLGAGSKFADIEVATSLEGDQRGFFLDHFGNGSTNYNAGFLNDTSGRFRLNGDNLRTIEFFSFGPDYRAIYRSLNRGDIESQKQFYEDLSAQSDISLLFNQFPGKVGTDIRADIMDRLTSLSSEGKLKNVFLLNAPNGEFFSNISVEQLQDLTERGTQVYWFNPHLKIWTVFDYRFWVNPEKLKEFISYSRSGRFAAFYGSSVNSSHNYDIVQEALEGYKKFHGGMAGVITGGGGDDSFMHIVSKEAKNKGLLVGAVYWNIPGVTRNYEVDFSQHFDDRFLLDRQSLMSRLVEVEFYGDGGIGTLLEFGNTSTMKKIGIGKTKPIIFIGNGWEKLMELIDDKVKNGLIPKHLLKYIYQGRDAQSIYDILCSHYKTLKAGAQ